MARSLSRYVRVRHVSGAEKDVLRTQLPQLSSNWKRATKKKRPSADESATAEPSADSASVKAESSNPTSPADPPDEQKE